MVLAVGRLRPPFADDVQHYRRLLARHARLELIEVREDERVERRLPERAFVSLLAADGQQLDSVGLSRFLEERRQAGRELWFVVGEGRAQPSDGQDHEPHRCDTTAQWPMNRRAPSLSLIHI